MSVSIFTKNQHFRRCLEDALDFAQIERNKENNPDLAVIFDENDKIKQEISCPFLEIGKEGTPLRLGALVDQIRQKLKILAIQGKETEIKIGEHSLNFRDNTMQKADGKLIVLTEKEVMILAFLYQTHPIPVPRDKLLHEVWGYADNVETHTLETHIYRLRQKIEDDPSSPQILITKEEGYGLNF